MLVFNRRAGERIRIGDDIALRIDKYLYDKLGNIAGIIVEVKGVQAEKIKLSCSSSSGDEVSLIKIDRGINEKKTKI